MTNLKVLIIDPVGGHGGMDYYAYGLAQGLSENGVRVDYHTCNETQVRVYEGVETYFSFGTIWKNAFLGKIFKFFSGYLRCFYEAKEKKIKIVHLHFFEFHLLNLAVLLILKIMQLKSVVTVHDVQSLHKSKKHWFDDAFMILADGVIVHNHFSAREIASKMNSKCLLKVIPHGNYLPFITSRVAEKSNNPVFTLLFFGQVKKVKRLEFLLFGLAQLKSTGIKIKLIVAGKPWKTDPDHYIDLINRLDIADIVDMHCRYIPDSEVRGYFDQADLVVLPYSEIYQSGVLLLSMSYGRPVLCSDLAPFREVVVHQKTGLLFQSENIDSLCAQIKFAMEHRDVLIDISRAADVLIRNDFDWKKIGEKTKNFYEDVSFA